MKATLGTGAYSLTEAARLTQIHPTTARRWFGGAPTSRATSFLASDFEPVQNRCAISFLDLIDLLVVGRLREFGISLQTVRRVYQRLEHVLATNHPFCHRHLLTDGKSIFLETVDAAGDPRLEEVISGQRAMPRILSRYLKKLVYDDETLQAVRWNIHRGVVLDPERSFGKPIVATVGIATHVLAQTYWANNDDVDFVADLFDVTPEVVRQAVSFEHELLAGRAA